MGTANLSPMIASIAALLTACSSTQNGSGAAGSHADAAASQGGASASPGGGSQGGGSQGGASQGGGSQGGASQGGASSGGAQNAGGHADNGASGGGMNDAGTHSDGGGPDPCATALFCEDFEGYAEGAISGSTWKTSTNLGQVSIVTSDHVSGQKSAQFSTEQSSGAKTAFIRLTGAPVFPVPSNQFFGRMMARLDAAPDQSVHWTFIQGGGLVPGQTYHALYRYGGQQPLTNGGTFVGTQLMANYETPDSYSGNGPSSDCWDQSDKVIFPVAKWTCVEWQFEGGTNTMRFWLDGTAVDSLTVQGKGQGCVHQPADFAWTAPTFDTLSLGWESYQADSARTLYIDDVVLASGRVGCPAP
jgi:hypothetical protein